MEQEKLIQGFANNLILLSESDDIENHLIVKNNELLIKDKNKEDKEYDVINDKSQLYKCIHTTLLESFSNMCLLKMSNDGDYEILLNDIINAFTNIKNNSDKDNEELNIILDNIQDKISDFIHISYFTKSKVCNKFLKYIYNWFEGTLEVFREINNSYYKNHVSIILSDTDDDSSNDTDDESSNDTDDDEAANDADDEREKKVN